MNKHSMAKSYAKYARSIKGRYRCLRYAAKRKKRELTISFEEFSKIITKPCYYCNGFFPDQNAGHGLDRLDNRKGYTGLNVVRACRTCNIVRGDILSPEETLAAIKAVKRVRGASK